MKKLASIAACLLLVLAAPGLASESDPDSRINPDIADSSFGPTPAHETPYDSGLTVLDAYELKAVAGTGAGTDFACGFATGAGLVVTLSGIGAPVGVALGAIGVACSLFF